MAQVGDRRAEVDDSRLPGAFSTIRFGTDAAGGGDVPIPDQGDATFDSTFDATFE
jgi:hypothetical protein